MDDFEKDVANIRAYMQRQNQITAKWVAEQQAEERRVKEVIRGKKLRLRAEREKANAARAAARERAMRENAESYAAANSSGLVAKAISGGRRRRKVSENIPNLPATTKQTGGSDSDLRETGPDNVNEE